MFINVKYTCKFCGVDSREVCVPARGKTEDIMDWMRLVQRMVGDDHTIHRPWCESNICDLKIPLAKDESKGVGHV